MQSEKRRDAKHKKGNKATRKKKVGLAISEKYDKLIIVCNHKIQIQIQRLQMQSEKRRDAKARRAFLKVLNNSNGIR